jgi:hypothetical protein
MLLRFGSCSSFFGDVPIDSDSARSGERGAALESGVSVPLLTEV